MTEPAAAIVAAVVTSEPLESKKAIPAIKSAVYSASFSWAEASVLYLSESKTLFGIWPNEIGARYLFIEIK